MIWADGTRFKGQWEEGAWVQSAAEPALCRLSGPGLARAIAGQCATFRLQVRTAERVLSVCVLPWV
jgi:hypothetical protein